MINKFSAAAVLLTLFVGAANAKSVTAIALFDGRAMLAIDGGKPKIVREGSTYKGVKVLSANTDEVSVEIDGRKETLTLNSTTTLDSSLGVAAASSYAEQITLYENNYGFFESDGEIDGRRIRFLIDTGANLVVLSSAAADAIGLEYQNGTRSFATTASGVAPMYAITLREISIGGIKLNNIGAGVIEGRFPEKPLLGMTFLRRLDMNRSGSSMILKRR